MAVFFTSDTHYGHKNIVVGCSNWEDKSGCRDFDTIEDHDQRLIDNINATVGINDELYHLGDWSFGGITNIWEFRRKIKCKTIHLILGNHDHHIDANRTMGMLRYKSEEERITDLPQYAAGKVLYGNYGWILEDAPKESRGMLMGSDKVYATHLFSSVRNYAEVHYNKQKIILCHYAMRVWNESHKGSWMLYGHSHGTLDELTPEIANPTWIGDQYYIKNFRTMDVGVDTHKSFRPYSYDEIYELMKGRDILLEVDHHNQKTN